MIIEFNLPHVFYPQASMVDNSEALETLLESLISINVQFLNMVRSCRPLYKSGIIYGRTKVWDSIPGLYARGYGDCKSLTAALIAESRVAGIKCRPVFRWKKRDSKAVYSSNDFHILCQFAHGFEDPSKVLGMGADENARFTEGKR
jgi:hypothetical protein